MAVATNGNLNFSRLAKALEHLHEQQTGERVTISIRKMTDEEKFEYEAKKYLDEKVRDSA